METMTTEELEKYCWDALYKEIKNPLGVAGLMGNLYSESRLHPSCLTGSGSSVGKMTSDYFDKLASREMSEAEFIHDGIAVGIAQWRYYTRKQLFYEYMDSENRDPMALSFQVDFLIYEMSNYYKKVWNGLCEATSYESASDLVMIRYEKPGNVGETAKVKRRSWAKHFYDKFAGGSTVQTTKKKYVVTTHDKVNIRYGNDISAPLAGQISKAGTKKEWVVTADNGWNGVKTNIARLKGYVVWVSPDYSKIVEE